MREVQGRVLVRLPGTDVFVDIRGLRQIPVGSQIDTRQGRVLRTVETPGGGLQSGVFNFAQCRARRALSSAGGRPRPSKPVRRVWGNTKGQFSTRGRYASATVRGTLWVTTDRCDGTLVGVRRGSVEVRDLVRGRTIVVRAGKSYLARARR